MKKTLEQRIREAVSKIGMVYFVRDDVAGNIKIGTAMNPLKRIQQLQTGSSVPLRLIAMTTGGRKEEVAFHAMWKKRRLAGEWFDDSDNAISENIYATSRYGGGFTIWPTDDNENPEE